MLEFKCYYLNTFVRFLLFIPFPVYGFCQGPCYLLKAMTLANGKSKQCLRNVTDKHIQINVFFPLPSLFNFFLSLFFSSFTKLPKKMATSLLSFPALVLPVTKLSSKELSNVLKEPCKQLMK